MQVPEQAEIANRLKLIEEMMAEGRRNTQRWGWVFLLWGIGPLIAMFWETHWPQPPVAWPVVLAGCTILNGVLIKIRKRTGAGRTIKMRSVGAVWGSTALTVLLVVLGSAFSGSLELRSMYVALFALVAVAHSTSSIILRWPVQFFAAVVWWAACLAALILPITSLHLLSMITLIVGNIVFGSWLTYRERSHQDE